MSEVLDSDTLAAIASEAAAAMFSIDLEPLSETDSRSISHRGRRAVLLRLMGAPEIMLALVADSEAGAMLASSIFEVAPEDADGAMVDDSLRELANIFAGQVKSMVAPEHHIGLPRVQSDSASLANREWHGVSFRIGGSNEVLDVALAA